MGFGRVIQVMGPVVDIKFSDDESVPQLLNAVRIEDAAGKIDLTLEVEQLIGNDTVRCIAMASTDGLVRGALETIDKAIQERLTRFRALAKKMEMSLGLGERFLPEEDRAVILRQQREFHDRWPELSACLAEMRGEETGREGRDEFLEKLAAARARQGDDYLSVIRSLDESARSSGTAWLQQVVDSTVERAFALIPACRGGAS